MSEACKPFIRCAWLAACPVPAADLLACCAKYADCPFTRACPRQSIAPRVMLAPVMHTRRMTHATGRCRKSASVRRARRKRHKTCDTRRRARRKQHSARSICSECACVCPRRESAPSMRAEIDKVGSAHVYFAMHAHTPSSVVETPLLSSLLSAGVRGKIKFKSAFQRHTTPRKRGRHTHPEQPYSTHRVMGEHGNSIART